MLASQSRRDFVGVAGRLSVPMRLPRSLGGAFSPRATRTVSPIPYGNRTGHKDPGYDAGHHACVCAIARVSARARRIAKSREIRSALPPLSPGGTSYE